MEHKRFTCDFCGNEVKPFRNGFNELYVELWHITIKKIRLGQCENAFSPHNGINNGDICKECLSKIPSQNNLKVSRK